MAARAMPMASMVLPVPGWPTSRMLPASSRKRRQASSRMSFSSTPGWAVKSKSSRGGGAGGGAMGGSPGCGRGEGGGRREGGDAQQSGVPASGRGGDLGGEQPLQGGDRGEVLVAGGIQHRGE